MKKKQKEWHPATKPGNSTMLKHFGMVLQSISFYLYDYIAGPL